MNLGPLSLHMYTKSAWRTKKHGRGCAARAKMHSFSRCLRLVTLANEVSRFIRQETAEKESGSRLLAPDGSKCVTKARLQQIAMRHAGKNVPEARSTAPL